MWENAWQIQKECIAKGVRERATPSTKIWTLSSSTKEQLSRQGHKEIISERFP